MQPAGCSCGCSRKNSASSSQFPFMIQHCDRPIRISQMNHPRRSGTAARAGRSNKPVDLIACCLEAKRGRAPHRNAYELDGMAKCQAEKERERLGPSEHLCEYCLSLLLSASACHTASLSFAQIGPLGNGGWPFFLFQMSRHWPNFIRRRRVTASCERRRIRMLRFWMLL